MTKKSITIFTVNDVYFDQRMIKIATALSEDGYKVTWVARAKSLNQGPHQNYPFEVKRWQFLFNKGPLFYLEYALRQLLYLLTSPKSDLLYCCDADTIGGVWLYSFLHKVQLIYDAHEYFSETPELECQPLKKRVWRWIERKGVALSQKRITVAHHLSEELSNLYGKPFDVVRNLPVLLDKTPFNKENIILYQGVLNKGRGLECAIQAMSNLSDYQLYICGDGDIKDELLSLAKDLPNVSFLGLKTPHELNKITEKATFGLNLLDLSSKNYYFSLANKFFDYAAHGVVSINSPGVEYLDYQAQYQHCLVLDNLVVEELASIIERTTEEDIKMYRQNGYRMMEENNWGLEKEKLLITI